MYQIKHCCRWFIAQTKVVLNHIATQMTLINDGKQEILENFVANM